MRLVIFLAIFSLLCFTEGVFGAIHRPLHSSGRFLSQSYSSSAPSSDSIYHYRTEYYRQALDHFNFASTSSFWNQRILINDTYWKPGQPIFLYAGNEGTIDTFANNTGFMFDIMQEFGAALIFPEHRYYGESMPINNSAAQSYASPATLQYLTAEQALADYAEYIQYWKSRTKSQSSPVVVFGGSYGGMLAAWFRLKYPHLIAGAIAASAPIFQFDGMVDPKTFNAIVSKDIRDANPYCGQGVEKTWGILKAMAKSPEGRANIQKAFGICDSTPITNPSDVSVTLFNWIVNAWTSMAMGDYPYSASFLGGMPGNPINVSCSYFTADTLRSNHAILAAHFAAISVYYNYTNQYPSCIPLNNGDIPTLGDTSTLGWNYQSCTEMVMPIGQYGPPNDVFDPAPWSTDAALASCQANYGITPRPHWVETHFTGLDLSTASNIVFTNGNLDPWSGGGVLRNWSDTVVSYIIEGGAHHLDLRGANPNDPPSVKWVREMQKSHIRNWVYGSADSSKSLPTKWAVAIAVIVTALVIIVGQFLYKYYEEHDPSKPSNKTTPAPAPAAVAERKDSVVVETMEHYPPSNAAAINNNGYAPLNNQIV